MEHPGLVFAPPSHRKERNIMAIPNFSWVTPGKLAGHAAPQTLRDLTWLRDQGIGALVRMAEESQVASDSQIRELGFIDCHEVVPDFQAPTQAQIKKVMAFIEKNIASGIPVGVSCGAGYGRTGTIIACYLVRIGFDAEDAMAEIRKKRPGSIETDGQESAVRAYARALPH